MQKFIYTTGGQDVTIDDPNNDYTAEQIKAHWATTFPELANATWDTKEVDGVKVVTFSKKVGTKGFVAARAGGPLMHPAIVALLTIPEKPLPGCDLLARLYEDGPASVDELLAVNWEIQDQIGEAEALARRSSEATQRCLELKPVPAPKAPLGF